MSGEFHECVDEFFGDPTVLQLLDRARETRPLRICYPREIPVSRFLAWILDPTEGHGLNDACLRALLGEAWRRADEAELDTRTRHSLAPTHVAAQSFDGCLLKREMKFGKKALDVLVLDPRREWLLAVENKYGAREGKNQLSDYAAGLKKLYPTWTRVLVFLDVFGQPPSSSAWIGLSYEWLVDEIAAAKGSPWLGADSKSALCEFLAAIQPEGDAFVHVDVEDEKLLQVVNEHRVVFERMRQWSRDRRPIEGKLASLYQSSKTQDERASQQLFQAFWQRRRLWDICVPMLLYAGLLQFVRKTFSDVECDPKRKAFYFYLPAWEALSEDPDEFTAVFTMVRILPPEAENGVDAFVIVSFIDTKRVRGDLQSPVLTVIQALRDKHLKRNRKMKDEPGQITLRVDRTTHEEEVKKLLVSHVRGLNDAFKDLV